MNAALFYWKTYHRPAVGSSGPRTERSTRSRVGTASRAVPVRREGVAPRRARPDTHRVFLPKLRDVPRAFSPSRYVWRRRGGWFRRDTRGARSRRVVRAGTDTS